MEPPPQRAVLTTTPAGGISAAADGITVRWLKIAASDFTGASSDNYVPLREDEKFTSGWYYACMISFKLKSGYKLASDVSATVNGKPSFNNGLNINTTYLLQTLNAVFEPLPETGLSAVPALKFELDGYEVGQPVFDISVTLDGENDAVDSFTGTNGYNTSYLISTSDPDTAPLIESKIDQDTALFEESRTYYLAVSISMATGYDVKTLTPAKLELNGYGKPTKLYKNTDSNVVLAVFALRSFLKPQQA